MTQYVDKTLRRMLRKENSKKTGLSLKHRKTKTGPLMPGHEREE